ncbi:MAG: Glutathione S-transferase, N-terminal domain [Candidatus Parcubacteria bacterium]|jgi:glutathione S-transferase
MVLHELAELALPFDEKNIADDEIAEELITRGGKRQVPYLVDDKDGTEMYESADIVEYLATTYGTETADTTAVNTANVCIPKELHG